MNKGANQKNIRSIFITLLIVALYLIPNFASAVSILIKTDKSKYENSDVVNFDVGVDVDSGEKIPINKLTLKVNDTLKTCDFRPDGSFISDCSNLKITSKKVYTNGYGYGNNNYGYGYGYGNEYTTKNTTFGSGYGYGAGYGYGQGYGYDDNLKVTDEQDGQKLDEIIKDVQDSLKSDLWTDSTHPTTDGGEEVFDKELQAVQGLQELIDDDSSLSHDALKDLSKRISSADRNIASVAISDAEDGDGNSDLIDEAKDELAAGDASAASGNYADAVSHYKEAWKKAIQSTED